MIRTAIILFAALALASALFVGSFGVFAYCESLRDEAKQEYCRAVVPNVGVTGLQTLLVSIFVVLIADRVRKAADYARRNADLNRKRNTSESISFRELLECNIYRKLYGFTIISGDVKWQKIESARFVCNDIVSSFLDVKIRDCRFKRVAFGNVRGGCGLDKVQIVGGSLQNVSFRNCDITVHRADTPFIKGAECRRLDFRDVTLKSVDLSDVPMQGALFWGARIFSGSQMPREQEEAFGVFGEQIVDPILGNVFRIKTLGRALRDVLETFIRGDVRDGAVLLRKVLVIEWRYRTAW